MCSCTICACAWVWLVLSWHLFVTSQYSCRTTSLLALYAVKAQRSLAPLSWFPGSRNLLRTCTNVADFRVMRRAEDCMPSPMKFTSEIYIAWTTFLGSPTTAPPRTTLWRLTLTAYWQWQWKSLNSKSPWPRCIKLTINGKSDFNGNFHRILDADWLWCLVAMVIPLKAKLPLMKWHHGVFDTDEIPVDMIDASTILDFVPSDVQCEPILSLYFFWDQSIFNSYFGWLFLSSIIYHLSSMLVN